MFINSLADQAEKGSSDNITIIGVSLQEWALNTHSWFSYFNFGKNQSVIKLAIYQFI